MYSNFALSIIGISRFLGEAVYHTYAHFISNLLGFMNNKKPFLCSFDFLLLDCTRRDLFDCSFDKCGFVHLNKTKQDF